MLLGGKGQERVGRGEGHVPLALAVPRTRPRSVRHPAPELRHEPREVAAHLSEVPREEEGRRVTDEIAERLDDRLVGNPDPLLAAPVDDAGPTLTDGLGHLLAQARLPDSRLPGDQSDPHHPAGRLFKRGEQHLPLALPAEEGPGADGLEARRHGQRLERQSDKHHDLLWALRGRRALQFQLGLCDGHGDGETKVRRPDLGNG